MEINDDEGEHHQKTQKLMVEPPNTTPTRKPHPFGLG
jgi:hypothetical protein